MTDLPTPRFKIGDMAYKLGDLKNAVNEALEELSENNAAHIILTRAMKEATGE